MVIPLNLICSEIMLQYTKIGDTTTIILSAPYTIGWVGIGFSRDGMMVGSSAMVGWINKHGHAKIKQFYLRGRKPSEVIADKGELPLNNVPAAVATNGAEIYLAFQLQTINPFVKQPILLAFGTKLPQNHHLAKHEDKTAIVFDFSSGAKSFLFDLNISIADVPFYNYSILLHKVSSVSKFEAQVFRIFSLAKKLFHLSEPYFNRVFNVSPIKLKLNSII